MMHMLGRRPRPFLHSWCVCAASRLLCEPAGVALAAGGSRLIPSEQMRQSARGRGERREDKRGPRELMIEILFEHREFSKVVVRSTPTLGLVYRRPC